MAEPADTYNAMVCTRCHLVPCACASDPLKHPLLIPIEAERPRFEDFMRRVFPDCQLTRYGHTYADPKVRNRWIGWCAHAHGDVRIVARRA